MLLRKHSVTSTPNVLQNGPLDVTTQDLEEFDTLNGEDDESEPSSTKGLTEPQKLRLKEFKEDARAVAFKDHLPDMVDIVKKSMLKVNNQVVPVPKPPTHWQELRGADHTEEEATNWLKYKLCEYDVWDAIAEARTVDIYHPNKKVYRDQQESLLRALEQLEVEDKYEGLQPLEI
ncbi:hypothetical protein V494_00356 [Pseudogymnoascus sp. VKM F-4513 (FW-928)]|nr:hypothetical protein V494_00356 [Pseudogymnoascus sp. VKM F-4513 (FW-928)]